MIEVAVKPVVGTISSSMDRAEYAAPKGLARTGELGNRENHLWWYETLNLSSTLAIAFSTSFLLAALR